MESQWAALELGRGSKGEIERRGTPNNVAETVVEMRVRSITSISILIGVGIY